MFRFRIMHGTHTDSDPDNPDISRTWRAGDVVETEQDLRFFNGAGQSPKFQLLDDGPEAAPNRPDPASDPGADLDEVAADEERAARRAEREAGPQATTPIHPRRTSAPARKN